MARNFADEHRKVFNKEVVLSKQGYPDTGSGRYSKMLSYRSWLLYNTKARAAANLLESVLIVTVFILVAAIKLPKAAAVLGLLYLLVRIQYVVGYTTHMPKKELAWAYKGRILPVRVAICIVFGLFSCAMYSLNGLINER